MYLKDLYLVSTRSLSANKKRAALTMLGIIIGIGSVIFIMTTGEVAKNFLLGQISQFGTNVIEVIPTGAFGPAANDSTVTLTDGDLQALQDSALLPEVELIDGAFSANAALSYDAVSTTVSLTGVRSAFFAINSLNLLSGRLFSDADVETRSRVIVLDEQLAKTIFDKQDPIGKRVKVDGTVFTVIGIVQPINSFGFGAQFAYAPISTTKQFFADSSDSDALSFLLMQFQSGSDSQSIVDRVRFILDSRHQIAAGQESPFQIVSRAAALNIFNTILIGIQAFISAVAAISLLVGGIGIMNIMLVTVKERTREIGLRKAIGAKNSSILSQFLIEAVVLTTVGGLIGIGVGLGLSLGVVALAHTLQPDWNVAFVFVPSAIVLACGVAMGVGVVFGLYPAWKASQLHPIEALRYE
jgi:putative ABC transport system permease protein